MTFREARRPVRDRGMVRRPFEKNSRRAGLGGSAEEQSKRVADEVACR